MADFTFAPLTPAAFLDRGAASFADRTAVVDGAVRLTYRDFADRCARLVSTLAGHGVGRGDRVAALCANSHVMLELHHAVPARGAALVSLNIRLTADEMAYIVGHSEPRLLVATEEYAELATRLGERARIPVLVAAGGGSPYETALAEHSGDAADRVEVEEHELLAINYTSGTTGRPKGVMYHHRGAALQAVAMAYHARLGTESRYLWTLPMFHCNGWCFTWAVTAAGGTHVCLRAVDPGEIWRLLRAEGVTHFSAAPTVLTMIGEHADAGPLERRVHVDTGGSPPSPALLARLEPFGMDVTHLYGLTETFGPIAINEWQAEWDDLDADRRSRLRARQGIGNIIARPLRVLDVEGADVPADGRTIGEIAARGNDLMLGYYRDDEATAAVTRSGCFLTGDLGVMHPDGYVEIRDRSKDIIISGGENIASVEVEQVLDAHPAVIESAVVAMPDERWGEVPVAFVTVRAGRDLDAAELLAFARERLAGFKVPKRVVVEELPRTSTGKIRKNVLRRRAADLAGS
ncbi:MULTISPECIES: acyl--CoA ligase family protein [unclassified Nocardioides]|uniref:acyl--CoA ligase family protein n=1 Tax=unclassified Nocardioides TaxID=2615069 RepID=UPI00360D285B